MHDPIELFPFFWTEPAGMTNIEGGQLVIVDAFAEFTFDNEQEMARRFAKYIIQIDINKIRGFVFHS